METITTNIFRTGSGKYTRGILIEWASRWWWALALPICAIVVAGFYDWRWWIAGVAIVLIVYPGALAMAYYYHALSPQAVRAILPQQASISGEGISIVYFPLTEDGATAPPRMVSFDDVKSWEDNGSGITLSLKSGRYDKINIPFSAFASNDDAKCAISTLEKTIPHNIY